MNNFFSDWRLEDTTRSLYDHISVFVSGLRAVSQHHNIHITHSKSSLTSNTPVDACWYLLYFPFCFQINASFSKPIIQSWDFIWNGEKIVLQKIGSIQNNAEQSVDIFKLAKCRILLDYWVNKEHAALSWPGRWLYHTAHIPCILLISAAWLLCPLSCALTASVSELIT